MRLTKASDYAVRCVYYLAEQGKDTIVNRKAISDEMRVPHAFLGKIAQQLSRAGILEIVQGPKGGLKLITSIENINLLEVIEAITGEIFLNDCILNPSSCFRSSTCSIHVVWENARDNFRKILKNATFAKLIEEGTCMKSLMIDHAVSSDE